MRGGVTKEILERNKQKAHDLLLEGKNAHEVSKIIGCSATSVSIWFPELANANRGCAKFTDEQKELIRAMRAEYATYDEIATATRLKTASVKAFALRHGLGLSEEGLKRIAERARTSEKEISVRVSEVSHGQYEYAGGYERVNTDEYRITVRCAVCGAERSVQSQTVRLWARDGHAAQCAQCATRERRAKREAEKEKKQEEKERIRQIRKICGILQKYTDRKDRETEKTCPMCGRSFITYKKRQLCCSTECSKERERSRQNHTDRDRRFKKNGVKKDLSISARTVYRRDGGICWLCGDACDLNDYRINDNGVVICGDRSPSVEHVTPLSRGGKDVWSNVRCAHRICNSKRGADDPPALSLFETA